MTKDEYCHSPDTKLLKPFFSEIWALKYEEEPNYNKLKLMLVKILIEKDFLPSMNLMGNEQVPLGFDEMDQL